MKLWYLVIIALLVSPIVMSQVPTPADLSDPYTRYIITGETLIPIGIGESRDVALTFEDRSQDGPSTVTGDDTFTVPGLSHSSQVAVEPLERLPGWNIALLTPAFQTYAGGTYTILLKIQTDASANVPLYEFDVNVTTRDRYGGVTTTVLRLAGYTAGLESFTPLASGGVITLKPDQIGETTISISNGGSLFTRSFATSLKNNPCGFTVSTPTITLVPGQRDEMTVSLIAPADRFWYASQSCLVQLDVFPTDAPGNLKTVTLMMKVNGVYIDGDKVVATLIAAGILTGLIIFFLARKARIEEEILGKPQAPWTIPAEKVYLSHLKKKDQRAWYTVRHYLMEEEYKSSMLWYSAYKHATKGERRRERIIVGHEHVYDRFEQKGAKRMAKPAKKADRNRGKLEKKVARAMRKAHKSDVRTYRKAVKGVEKAHDKKVKKALKKWSKLAKKAAKKGAHAPPQPHFDAPTHANAPSAAAWSFDDHKLALKEAKFRAKMARKESKLRAQHTREESKIKAKVRRKVEKMAKKLDDPSFINSLDVLQD